MSKETVHSSPFAVHGGLEETKKLARKLAQNAKRGDVYCLIGDLGAGKTEFARAFIQELCGDVNVGSPTFNILQVYEIGTLNMEHGKKSMINDPCSVFHFDLYRLKDASELAEIGLEDALDNGITLIEWPQIAEELLPSSRVMIRFEILDEGRRKIIVT